MSGSTRFWVFLGRFYKEGEFLGHRTVFPLLSFSFPILLLFDPPHSLLRFLPQMTRRPSFSPPPPYTNSHAPDEARTVYFLGLCFFFRPIFRDRYKHGRLLSQHAQVALFPSRQNKGCFISSRNLIDFLQPTIGDPAVLRSLLHHPVFWRHKVSPH